MTFVFECVGRLHQTDGVAWDAQQHKFGSVGCIVTYIGRYRAVHRIHGVDLVDGIVHGVGSWSVAIECLHYVISF